MTQPHASRDHTTWSASASERRFACPGSLAMETETGAPADKESHAAAWGTAAHEVAERALRGNKTCATQIGRVVKTKEHEITVDDEVAECAQVYVDYVLKRARFYDDGRTFHSKMEQRYSLANLDPPFEAGGTADCVLLVPHMHEIEIVDLKGGRGIVVEAEGNKQLRTYALAAMLAERGSWDTVRMTIVQPRAPHPDGPIRSETIGLIDMMGFQQELLEAMDRAHRATTAPEGYLTPGDHCTFCCAKPTCPALQMRALEIAKTHFDDETAPQPPAPETLEIEQIVRILDHADMIQEWLNSVRAYAQDLAESGVEVASGDSRYVLTDKQARREWVGKVEQALVEVAAAAGEDVRDLYQEPKPMSPNMVEKFLGKKRYGEVAAAFVEKRSSGYNLTRADKTTRPAVVPPAHQFFDVEVGD